MDKNCQPLFSPLFFVLGGAAKSRKMHHFHDRQCTLITWEVVVNDNNKEGVANQCNES